MIIHKKKFNRFGIRALISETSIGLVNEPSSADVFLIPIPEDGVIPEGDDCLVLSADIWEVPECHYAVYKGLVWEERST